ncbi:MAG: hypothetical protein AB1489_00740 [Acidobacteriota bacterium]
MEHLNEPNFIFELENVRSLEAHEQLLAWAERVFAEPNLEGQSFDVRLFDGTCLSPEQEVQLYNDFQSRDSELGMSLVNWRKADLAKAISVVRAAVAKRYLTISLTRTRIDAIEKINQAEPNPYLRYSPQAIEDLRAEVVRATQELSYLRARISQMHALEHLLRTLYLESKTNVNSRSSEQLLRLLGQGWRGFQRVRAWSNQFHVSNIGKLNQLPIFNFNHEIQGHLLKLGPETKPVVINRHTARYLLHILASIDALAEASIPLLEQPGYLRSSNWYPISTMLRSIVEFFHFCNFEMPLFYLDVAVDLDDPAQLYRKKDDEWETLHEEVGISTTLKRIAAEAALLLVEGMSLLECTDMDRLDRLLKFEAADVSTIEQVQGRDVQPFSSCGLSEFDLDPAGQRIKFRVAFPLMSSLLELLVTAQSGLKWLPSSALGSPLKTILGLATLDPEAFGLPAGSISDVDRFDLLARFWRTVGRRRAISMLGEEYVQKVSVGLQALGQPSPEHPTFLTLQLPAVIAGKEQFLASMASTAATERDALPGLAMADQMRIIDLVNITWALADDFMLSLRDMNTEEDFYTTIQEFPRMVSSYRNELVRRFNEKWLHSMNWIWSMVRGISPMIWDFWIKVGDQCAWDEMVARTPAAAAMGLLLRLFCDTVRLVLLIELSGSAVAGGLRVNAESASQVIMLGLERFFVGPNTPVLITESIDYYFDPEIRFDSWLSFVSSYKNFLIQSINDLQQMGAAVEHRQLLEKVRNELERLYPTRVVAGPPPKSSATKEYTIGFLAEALAPSDKMRLINEMDAAAFYKVCFEMLAATDNDSTLFLRLLSMFRRTETHDWIYEGARYKALIEQLLPDYRHRRLLYCLPSRADSFFRLLGKLETEGRTSHVALELMQPQVLDYFEQLNDLYISTAARFAACPRVLPRESADLLYTRLSININEHTRHPFLLLLACDQPILYLDAWKEEEEQDEAHAVTRVRAELSNILREDIDDPLIEIFSLGGGQITIGPGRAILYGSSRLCEPAFIELDKPISRLLLSKFVSNKFILALEILRDRFPKQRFVVQP